MSEYGAHTKAEYRKKALKNLDIPLELRPYEYEVGTVLTGGEVLAKEGLSFHDVLVEPRHLLVGDAYDGGCTLAIDPFHPATPALVALRLADGTGNPHSIHSATIRAAIALDQHGVPSEIETAYAIGIRADEFSAVDVIGVMPDLAGLTGWRERAQAAHEMLGALVAVPRDNPARGPIWEYTWHLANPGVPLPWMQPYGDAALRQLTVWGSTHSGGGWGIHQ